MAEHTEDRTASFALGIPGDDLRQETKSFPEGEPQPWPPNNALRVVGKPARRLEGHAKVTGQARYTADVRLRGMLYARRIVATVPHARITAFNSSRAERVPGFKAIHLLERTTEGLILRDPSAEAGARYPTVRYVGQPLGAVAALTQEAADEAARLVGVSYERLPFTVDLDAAMSPEAPLVYPGAVDQRASAGGGTAAQGLPQKGNVRGPTLTTRGDIASGFAQAEVVIEGTFSTQVQVHSAMETHGVVAHWDDEWLTVYASTQGTAGVRDDLAALFDLPKEKVRVVSEHIGGGFGAKVGAGSYGVLATQLSRKTGRPVRLMVDRTEEQTSTGNRPATRQRLKIGARRDGILTAIQLESFGTAGIGTGAGVGFGAERMYACPNFSGAQSDVFIHAGPGAAFRAPGMPQSTFALEQLIDELAERLALDPLVLRDRIDVREDAAAHAHRVERRLGADRIGWSRRHAPGSDDGTVKRGLGVAQALWPHNVRPASCEVAVSRAGEVELRSSVQDIGTGTRTVLAQVVAEELGLRPEEVRARIGDTAFPDGPHSGGSNVTGSITPVARNAAALVGREVLARAAKKLGVEAGKLAFRGGSVVLRDGPSRRMSFREAAALLPRGGFSVRSQRTENYGYSGSGWRGAIGGVQFVEVAVDVETGIVRVERVVAVQDCGRPINPAALESQVNGGVLQGISYALFEERLLDGPSGYTVNADLEAYKMVGARETPQIEVVLIEDYHGTSSTDARGIAEPANIATAAAIANAFYNATGVRIRELPMNPRRVLAALESAGGT
ncbi:MAG TPA: xanthine dehydrogenase family protein molybdopterin-binding subunit [Anaeromyxobacteraceae bacterium]|nr:xanthine dehydrogenase family protein molybdopterin-binding subunit [Anaeromyxobacteraceae bacterium]